MSYFYIYRTIYSRHQNFPERVNCEVNSDLVQLLPAASSNHRVGRMYPSRMQTTILGCCMPRLGKYSASLKILPSNFCPRLCLHFYMPHRRNRHIVSSDWLTGLPWSLLLAQNAYMAEFENMMEFDSVQGSQPIYYVDLDHSTPRFLLLLHVPLHCLCL